MTAYHLCPILFEIQLMFYHFLHITILLGIGDWRCWCKRGHDRQGFEHHLVITKNEIGFSNTSTSLTNSKSHSRLRDAVLIANWHLGGSGEQLEA